VTTPVNEFELIAGDTPSETRPHQPRTIRWNTDDGPTQMMSEIGPGVFVGWLPNTPDAAGVPVEPEYIQRWREAYLAKTTPRTVTDTSLTMAYAGLTKPIVQELQGDNSDVGF
jgi:hypothetical protein